MTSTPMALRQRLFSKALRQSPASSAKGFTLVELMIVVAIVGILAAVGIPQFLGVRNRAEAKTKIGEAVGIAKECASLQIEAQSGATVTPPGGGAAVTCDGSGAATITSQTFTATTSAMTCLAATLPVGATSATIAITATGQMTCS